MRRGVLKTGGDEDGQGRTRFSVLHAGLIYFACVVVGVAVVAHAVLQVGQAWLSHMAPGADRDVRSASRPALRASVAVTGADQPALDARAPHLSPTVERIKGDPEFWAGLRRQGRSLPGDKTSTSRRDRVATYGAFGYRPMARFSDDPDGEEMPVVAYRTLCVRMCDGYYFPISFSAPQERFAADAAQCQSRCGGEARLFVHRNPGSAVEDMQDLQGRSYAQLPNAFLYRTQYVANCKCRPDPWEPQAREQHQLYALASAAKGGDVKAQAALSALSKDRREIALRAIAPPKASPRMAPIVADLDGRSPLARGRDSRSPNGDGDRRMGLGRGGDAPPNPGPASGDLPSWARAVFSAN